MRILVSGGTSSMRRFAAITAYRPYLGHLVTPMNGNRMDQVTASGLPFACDNGAFSKTCPFSEKAYFRMLHACLPCGPAWVTMPDIVGSAHGTIGLYDWWLRYLTVGGIDLADLDEGQLPLALVAQDGLDGCDWDYWFGLANCLFIGGTTEFKLSRTAAGLVREAKARGLAVHMGRVNSVERLLYAASIGCDSVDGLSFNKFGDTYIPAAIKALMEFQGDPSASSVTPARRRRKSCNFFPLFPND